MGIVIPRTGAIPSMEGKSIDGWNEISLMLPYISSRIKTGNSACHSWMADIWVGSVWAPLSEGVRMMHPIDGYNHPLIPGDIDGRESRCDGWVRPCGWMRKYGVRGALSLGTYALK